MSDTPAPPQSTRLADGTLMCLAALIAALFTSVAVAWVPVVAALLLIIIHRGQLGDVIKSLWPWGWIGFLLVVWICASTALTDGSQIVLVLSGALVGILFLGVPAGMMTVRAPGAASNHGIILALIAVFLGVAVFEAASGGFLGRMVPVVGSATERIVIVLSILMWPLAGLIHARYGVLEAAIWVLVGLGVFIVLRGFGGIATAVVGIAFFAIGFASLAAARWLLVLLILLFALVVPLAIQFVPGPFEMIGDRSGLVGGHIDVWMATLQEFGESVNAMIFGFGVTAMIPAASGYSTGFSDLALGIGVTGLVLTLVFILPLVSSAVQSGPDRWHGPAASATVATILAQAIIFGGIWNGAWFGACGAAALLIAAGRVSQEAGGSLGSIFDSAKGHRDLYALRDDDDAEEDYDSLGDSNYERDEARSEGFAARRAAAAAAAEEALSAARNLPDEEADEDEEWEIDLAPPSEDDSRR